jgi:hypothetical protein
VYQAANRAGTGAMPAALDAVDGAGLDAGPHGDPVTAPSRGLTELP